MLKTVGEAAQNWCFMKRASGPVDDGSICQGMNRDYPSPVDDNQDGAYGAI